MKIKTILLALCFGLGSLFAAHGQDAGRLSVNRNNVPLSSVITEIESKTDYTFFINDGRIDVDRNVSLSVNNATLTEALDKMFAPTPYAWAISGKQIVLSVRTTAATPQSRTVTGRVTGSQSEALAGVLVMQQGTSNVTVTDTDGAFTITLGRGSDNLEVSILGYTPQIVSTTGLQRIQVTMNEDDQRLDEIVVLGYGTAHAREVTSSITQISGSSLVSGIGGSNIATALQGKIAGLTIDGSASPNASQSLQLRGVASINAGSSPLVVIDGIPGGALSAVDQNDIETITVLKDASAGAIYGTRAAGGVILVTTKRARAGAVAIKYSGEFSTEAVRKRPDFMTASEYLAAGIGDKNYGADSDWYDALLVDAPFSHRHSLTISGGSEAASVYTSLGMGDQTGIRIGDTRKDYSARLNARFRALDGVVELTLNTNYRKIVRDENGGGTLGDSKGMFNMAGIINPTIPIYADNNQFGYNYLKEGTYKGVSYPDLGMSNDFWNPLAQTAFITDRGATDYIQADATLKINITPALSLNGVFGWEGRRQQDTNFTSSFSRSALESGYNGWASHGFAKDDRLSSEAYLNYGKTFGDKHRLDAVAGWSFWEFNNESFSARNSNFPVEGIGPWSLGSGSALNNLNERNGGVSMASAKSVRERLLSMFGRANYSYDNRYMATVSYRREGSSKFGANNRWGDFWAVSGGWRISSESFMEGVSWVNDLKLRAGYGVVGNNTFGAGSSERTYAADSPWLMPNGLWIAAYGQSRNWNPDLKWEEKHELNIGLDFSLFDNRLWGKFDIYQRKDKNLLYNAAASVPPAVASTTLKNIGTLSNKGWEIEIGGDIVRNKNITYSSSLNISRNTSKLDKLGTTGNITGMGFPAPGNPGSGVRLLDGSSIGQFWVFKHAGWDENGDWLIYDRNNEVVPIKGSDAEGLAHNNVVNKHWVGNAIPKIILAWEHNFRYKNLDVGLQLRSFINFDIYNQLDMYYGMSDDNGWNVMKGAYEKNKHITGDRLLSDYFIEDGTFLKIDNIYVGYTLQTERWIKYLKSARVYLTVRDPLVLSGYSGMDPSGVNVNGLYPGFDQINSVYPKLARFTFGIDLTF